MNTVFIGGSRHVSHLPVPVQERLRNIVSGGHKVIVGDASGVDKAVQKFLHDASYERVTVFCSGEKYRNNLGQWPSRNVETGKNVKGFQFYAAKDREMAREADFGLMIWDGESPGTMLNVLRLVRSGKSAVLFDVPHSRFETFKTLNDWGNFIAGLNNRLVIELKSRATPDEWLPPSKPEFFEQPKLALEQDKTVDELVSDINLALNIGDTGSAVASLGEIARMHGMSQIARESGLARESLYRSLKGQGSPEFATVLKVLHALDLRLTLTKACEDYGDECKHP